MSHIHPVRLLLLRGMYLLIFAGLALTVWPEFIAAAPPLGDSHSVITTILVSFSLLALLGIRYPLKMIPILLFELLWKTLWVLNYATRMWLGEGLDDYAAEVLFACLIGIILTPIAIPWGYVFRTYLKERDDPWIKRATGGKG